MIVVHNCTDCPLKQSSVLSYCWALSNGKHPVYVPTTGILDNCPLQDVPEEEAKS
jgi:hypothetical protein